MTKKVVQELLVTPKVSITLDRYSHMTPRLMSNAARGHGPVTG
jgi:hypothetical protein